jgi:NAD(P)-dependent dehydrogenase (short-subunit alcohol dehydrogenase family)
MTARAWLITGVSSGFGRELTSQLLDRGDRVIGTVRDTSKSPTSPAAGRTRSSPR